MDDAAKRNRRYVSNVEVAASTVNEPIPYLKQISLTIIGKLAVTISFEYDCFLRFVDFYYLPIKIVLSLAIFPLQITNWRISKFVG